MNLMKNYEGIIRKIKFCYTKMISYISFIKIKFIIFIMFNLILLVATINRINKLNQIKICICTVGKNENRYIKEYIEYYKNLGIDKIFLYDNNNIDGEYFEDIIKEYKTQNYVEIINWRGVKSPQMMIYHDCYSKNYNKYEWLLFNDIDEYLYLKNFHNIKDFLIQYKFNNCENIHLNWLLYTDNNLIYYQNKTLKKRFTEKDPNIKNRIINIYSNGKSILRGHIPNITIVNFHSISDELKICDGFGRNRNIMKPDYKYYYFIHYYCKSTEEFIEKVKKGDVYKTPDDNKIGFYFDYNKITFEKLNFIEKELKLNLTYYKNILNKQKRCLY